MQARGEPQRWPPLSGRSVLGCERDSAAPCAAPPPPHGSPTHTFGAPGIGMEVRDVCVCCDLGSLSRREGPQGPECHPVGRGLARICGPGSSSGAFASRVFKIWERNFEPVSKLVGNNVFTIEGFLEVAEALKWLRYSDKLERQACRFRTQKGGGLYWGAGVRFGF